MKKKKQSNIWGLVARLILRNRIVILAVLIALTGFWASQWKYMQFTFTEANLLPDDHPENILYQSFVKTFLHPKSVMPGVNSMIVLLHSKKSTLYFL